jgi:hypothetical protein
VQPEAIVLSFGPEILLLPAAIPPKATLSVPDAVPLMATALTPDAIPVRPRATPFAPVAVGCVPVV